MNKADESPRSTVELKRILPVFLEIACQTSCAEVGYVAMVDAGTGNLTIRHKFGDGSKDLMEGAQLPPDKGIPGWAVAHKQTVLILDVASDPRWTPHERKALRVTPRDMVCVPLMTGGRVIGVVTLLNKKGGTFDETDVSLAESVGLLASSAIENTRLYEIERRDRRFAQTLSAFTIAITQSLDVNVVLRVLLDYLGQLIPYDMAVGMLIEWDSRFTVRAVRGGDGATGGDLGAATTFDCSAVSVLRKLLDKQQGSVVRDIRSDPAWAGYPHAADTRSWMGIPLLASGRVIGMYSLAKNTPGYYRGQDLELASLLAAQTSVAIQSAWLFEKVGEGRSRLQSLTRQLVRTQENERRAVSRELHDEAGQSLASLKLGLHLLGEKVGDEAAVRVGILDLQQQVEGVMIGLHRLAANLRPVILDHVGLAAAVRQMVDAQNLREGPKVEFEGGRYGKERLPEFTETALYRIAQESLSNAFHHSRAAHVSVLLERREGHVVVVIEDDGVGFDPILALRSGRLGLLGMRERAEMLGGTLHVESSEGKGTTIVAEVPDADPNLAG